MSIWFDRMKANLPWARNGTVAIPTNDQQDKGLAFIGADTPTKPLHDAIWQACDNKANYTAQHLRNTIENVGGNMTENDFTALRLAIAKMIKDGVDAEANSRYAADVAEGNERYRVDALIINQYLPTYTLLSAFINRMTSRNSQSPSFMQFPSGIIFQRFSTPIVNFPNANAAVAYTYTFPTAFNEFCTDIHANDGGFAGITWGSFYPDMTRFGGTGFAWSLTPANGAQGSVSAWGR